MTDSKRAAILLTESEVRRSLSMSDAIQAMQTGFTALSTGDAEVPVRTHIPLEAFDGSVLFMPAYAPDLEAFSTKVVSIHSHNREHGLDAVQGVVILFDATTGRMKALLDGKAVTAIRTGAGSGLATKLLSREEATVVAILGSGVQARSHLDAISCVRKIEVAYCLGRSIQNAEAFATRMSGELDVDVVATQDHSVLASADIICTTTTATEPILSLTDLKPGVHINAVGSHRPAAAEIAADVVAAAKLVVDHREACLTEAGDIIQPIRAGLISEDHIFAELGEIAAGQKPGRESDEEITVFKSVGIAIQDLAAATTAVRNAVRLGLGKEIELS